MKILSLAIELDFQLPVTLASVGIGYSEILDLENSGLAVDIFSVFQMPYLFIVDFFCS